MTGTQQYDEKYKKLASGLIEKHSDLSLLGQYYYYILSDMSYTSAYTYLNIVKNFLVETKRTGNGDVLLSDYSKYLTDKKQYTPSYLITIYTALEKFSTLLKINGLGEDYMAYIHRPKFKESAGTKKKRENKYLDKEEIASLVEHIKKCNKNIIWRQRDLTVVLLFLNTGIRCAALQKLDVSDLDLDSNSVFVTDKGGDPRQIILSDNMCNELRNWLDIRNSIGAKDDALFITKFRKRMTSQSIYNMIVKYNDVVGEKILVPHTLRATYGTNLYDVTHDLFFVQDCMNHSSPKTTELYIRGKGMDNNRKAAGFIDSIVFA